MSTRPLFSVLAQLRPRSRTMPPPVWPTLPVVYLSPCHRPIQSMPSRQLGAHAIVPVAPAHPCVAHVVTLSSPSLLLSTTKCTPRARCTLAAISSPFHSLPPSSTAHQGAQAKPPLVRQAPHPLPGGRVTRCPITPPSKTPGQFEATATKEPCATIFTNPGLSTTVFIDRESMRFPPIPPCVTIS